MTTVLYLRVITSVILACFQLNRKKIKHLFICTLNRVICVNTIMEHFVRVIKYVLGIMKSFNCCIIVNKPIKQRVPPQPDVGTYSREPGWTRNCIREKVSYSSSKGLYWTFKNVRSNTEMVFVVEMNVYIVSKSLTKLFKATEFMRIMPSYRRHDGDLAEI